MTRYGDFKLKSTKSYTNKNTVKDVLDNLLYGDKPGISLNRAENFINGFSGNTKLK